MTAQVKLSCDFCDQNEDELVKCINCNIVLCEFCKSEKHSKIKDSGKHYVVGVKQLGTEEAKDIIRKVALSDLTCSSHEDEKATHICQMCSSYICLSCELKCYRGHSKSMKLETAYTRKLDRLNNLKDATERELQVCSRRLNETRVLKSDDYKDHKKIKETIEKTEKDVIEGAREKSKHLRKELDELCKIRNSSINDMEKNLQNIEDFLRQSDQTIMKTLMSENPDCVLVSPLSFLSLSQIKPVAEASKLDRFSYLPREDSKIDVDLGLLVKLPKFQILNECKRNANVSALKNFEDGTIVSFSPETDALEFSTLDRLKYSFSEQTINVSSALLIDMTLTNDGRILLSLANNSIMLVSKDGEFQPFISLEPFENRGIHCTNKGIIIIGFREQQLEMPHMIRRGIVIVDQEQNQKTIIELEIKNSPIFTCPDRITTNVYGDICIVDSTCDDSFVGRVVVLGAFGQVKWHYDGNKIINSITKFTPVDIATTSSGLIIVADVKSSALHVLSIKGDFLLGVNLVNTETPNCDIKNPLSLANYKNEKLLVGCEVKTLQDTISHEILILDLLN